MPLQTQKSAKLFQTLVAIHAELVYTTPAARVHPVTSLREDGAGAGHNVGADVTLLSDKEEDDLLDEFLDGVDGMDASDANADGFGARSEQSSAASKPSGSYAKPWSRSRINGCVGTDTKAADDGGVAVWLAEGWTLSGLRGGGRSTLRGPTAGQ